MNIRDLRYLAMRRDGFSDEEADWYADRRIGGLNVRRIRRLRRRFIRDLEEEERATFYKMMDDYIAERVKPGEEPDENIYSPGHEDIENVEAFWWHQLEGEMRIGPK